MYDVLYMDNQLDVQLNILLCTSYIQAKGFSYMLDVAQSKRKKDANIVASAQYNVGRAYFMVRG